MKVSYDTVRHYILSDRSFLFQKWLDWILSFPGLAYISHELLVVFLSLKMSFMQPEFSLFKFL